MGKGSGSKGSGTKKWIPKGSEQDGGQDEEQDDKPKTPKAKNPKTPKSKKEVTSPLLLEPSTGPIYDKMQLLRLFNSCKKLAAEEGSLTTAPKPAEIVTEEESGDLAVVLEARPVDQDEGKTPGSRRALREQMKAERIIRRLSSGALQDPDEVTTPSGGKTLDLTQELPEGASSTTMTPASTALMMYLQNMAAYAPYMAMGYPGGYTTVMLRNIPNRYTRDMLCDRLDKGYKGQYDFVYLPIDFNSKCNVGYAFINYRTPPSAQRFIQEFHGAKTKHCLPGFSSAKVCEVSYGRVQGRDQNMENLRDEKFIEKLVDRPEWQPLFLDERGKEIPFSKTLGAGSKKRIKGTATPSHMLPPGTPAGYMMPSPYGSMMYPTYGMPPPAPPTTLASVLPTALGNTTLMLRGLPTSYSREKLLEFLNSKYSGTFDFLFLQGEAKNEGGNRGFSFINFRSTKEAEDFTKGFSEKKVSECFPDAPPPAEGEEEKVCEVTPARLESLEKSIERLQTAGIEQGEGQSSSWHPVLVNKDGEVETFPTLSAASASAAARSQAKSSTPSAAKASQPSSSSADGKESEPATPSDKKAAKKPDKKAGKGAQAAGTPTALSAAAAAAAYPYGMMYPGYFGYPGYGAYAGYGGAAQMAMVQHAAAVSRAAAAVQAAHLQAQAAAQGHAGDKKHTDLDSLYSSVLDPLAAAVNPKEAGKPLTPENKEALRRQMEFYFSTNNLCKDLYLRQHMGADGWTSLELLSQFPMVRKFKATLPELTEVVAESTFFEINTDTKCLRIKNEEERIKWSKTTVPAEHTIPG